jgi:hypothetical protein
MLAMMHRKQHKLTEACDVLKQADDATGGTSAEVQYNLGLINLELGNTEGARANARTAYALGYPLPGLKNLLRKKGEWNGEDDRAVEALIASNGVQPRKTVVADGPPPQSGKSAAEVEAASPVAGSQ